MKAGFSHVWQIARLTFLEAVRQRFFNFLLLLCLALIGSANFFRKFDFGSSELRFITDFGFGGVVFFGTILAIVSTAQLFFGEIENRTALTLLAKPVRRWSFIAGKFLGVAMLLLVFVALLTTLLGCFLAWRQGQLMDELGKDFTPSQHVQYAGLAANALLQWVKFCVLAAITMFIATYSTTNLYTVAVSFFVLLICQLQYIAQDNWQNVESPFWKGVIWLLARMFPNFQVFSVAELMTFPAKNPVPASAVAYAAGYGAIYVVVLLALAVVSFRSREI